MSYIYVQVQVQMQECVSSMTTSHQIFNVTVEHLLILSPEAMLNNQVPISEYIYHQII